MAQPVKGEAYTFICTLISQATPATFQANPTLAAGDVQVSIDGGAFANITTLPTVSPAAGRQVEVTVSATEMNGDVIGILFHDAAGDEWQDLYVFIPTNSQEIDDLATAADVWAYATRTLTQSASQVTSAVSGSDIAVNSYHTWTIALTDVGDISSRTALYFTAKQDPENDADSASIVQVEETLGLLYIDGEAGTAAHGSITVTDAAAGDLTIVVSASATGIPRRAGQYSVKMVTATDVQYMSDGSFTVSAIPGRAIT